MRDQHRLASFTREHSIRSHPLTAGAAQVVGLLPADKAAVARRLLEDFAEATMGLDTHAAPVMQAYLPEDGSVLLDWAFEDRRFGISVEQDEGESGWYFVFSREPSTRYEAGTMDQLDMRRMVELALEA